MQRCFVLHLCKELAPGNVSFPQFFLLAYLDQKEVLTMTAIAQKMGHTTAAASGLVARLENLGMVVRSIAREDRRKVMVCITPKGSALVRRIRLNPPRPRLRRQPSSFQLRRRHPHPRRRLLQTNRAQSRCRRLWARRQASHRRLRQRRSPSKRLHLARAISAGRRKVHPFSGLTRPL